MDWFLVSMARLVADRPDVVARRLKFDLCADCDMDRDDRHHSPGYRMDRSPYDIPGHAFVSMADVLALVSAS